MGFEDLDDAAGEQDGEDDQPEDRTTEAPETTMPETTTDSTTTDGSLTEPGFPFAESSQEQVYPRESTWEDLQDVLDFEVKRELRDRGVKDVTGRELHDALLRVAMTHDDEIVENVLDVRQER